MNGRKTATKGRSGKRVASRRVKTTAAAPAPQPTPSPPDEPLRQQKYQELIRNHLDKLLGQLFAEFTHLHFHIAWAPATSPDWDERSLPTACSVCCRLSGSPLLKDCRICGPRRLARALLADGDGQHFTCRLGVHNYWLPVRVRGETLGIAYLQALDHAPARRPDRNRSPRTAAPRRHQADAVVMSRSEFIRAARLLQLIVQHVQTASLSDLRKADLTSAGRAVLALEKEQTRLHEALQRHLSPLPAGPRRSGPESHAEQIVHHLIERIELEYAKPITLRQYARELGMNAAYLSDLFSHALGVNFKTCLTGVRMAKAKILLGDPAQTASAVAYAIGYASENRFRSAFKKATGLSPKLWRETMQIGPPP